MAHWFHRNPLKATSQVNFDMRMVASDGQALRICSELRQARSTLLNLLPDANHSMDSVESALKNYMSLLQGFINACDESGGESKLRFSTRFRWTNSMLGKTPDTQQDAIFELVSICLNSAICLSKHAALLAGKDDITMEEAKEVHTCLRKAAGIITTIQENYVGKLLDKPDSGSDLDPRVMGAYLNQCTAEAQEVTMARAIELKHSPSLISALGTETSKLFLTAASSISGLDSSKFDKWKKYLTLKHNIYNAYAYCYAGENLLSQEKCGEAVRSLQESQKLVNNSEKACKEYMNCKGPGTTAKPDQHAFFQKLRPLVQRTLEKCDRENGFIFHQKVPYDVTPLETKATYGLASPEKFEMPPLNELWSAAVYKAFDISKNVGQTDPANSKAAQKAEGDLSPVKEINTPPGTKPPKNESGCSIS